MNLKTLAAQHEKFAETQARKAERQKVKDAAAAKKAEKDRQWTLTKESWRKKQERRDRAADLAQQRRLEDDPNYLGGF